MPRIPKKTKVRRLNLELATNVRTRMELLRDETGAHSLTEVISRSLAIYDYLWEQKKAGGKLLIQDSEGTREVVIIWPCTWCLAAFQKNGVAAGVAENSVCTDSHGQRTIHL